MRRLTLLTLTIGMTTVLTALPAAADCGKDHAHAATDQKAKMEMMGGDGMTCADMAEMRSKMQREQAEADTELAAMVERMEAATGQQKVDLLADIVAEMVEQRHRMHQKRAEMQPKMMKHMMGHMEKMSAGDDGHTCPMMAAAESGSEHTH